MVRQGLKELVDDLISEKDKERIYQRHRHLYIIHGDDGDSGGDDDDDVEVMEEDDDDDDDDNGENDDDESAARHRLPGETTRKTRTAAALFRVSK